MMKTLGIMAGSIAVALSLAGCAGDDGASVSGAPAGLRGSASHIDVCGTPMTRDEARELLVGNLYVVGAYRAEGSTAAELAVGLGLTMALNGIDFTDPSPKYEFKAEDGTYGYKNGDAGWAVTLTWAQDVGSFKAGEKIALDVFSVDTFVKNVRVETPTLSDPTNFGVRWDPGPLAILIDGDVTFYLKNPRELGIKLKLRPELIALELSSTGKRRGSRGNAADTFSWKIATLRATLPEILEQARAGAGYGLTFEDSRYESPTFGLAQDFGPSRVMVIEDDGRVHLEGRYDATLRVTRTGNERVLFQRGLVSSRAENETEYFCDAARTRRLGVATHATSLDRGTFRIDATGESFDYGLAPF